MVVTSSDGGKPQHDDLAPNKDYLGGAQANVAHAAGSGGPRESASEIDEYMARLLDRLNQKSAQFSSTPSHSSDSSGSRESTGSQSPGARSANSEGARGETAPAVDTRAGDQAVQRPASSAATTKPPQTAAGLTGAGQDAVPGVKRARPPESWNDISAMRELANLSARDAIDAYSAKRLIFLACGKLMVAVVAAMAAVLLLNMAANHNHLILFSTGLATFIALWWGFQSALLWRRSIQKAKARRRSGRE